MKQKNGKEKVRRYLFVILHGLLCALVFGYVKELYDTVQVIEPASNVNIDGSDFTALANFMVEGFNFGFSFFLLVLDGVFMLILSLILLVPYRLIAIRKETMPLEGEKRWFLSVMGIGAAVILLLGLIFVGIQAILPTVILYIIPGGLELLLFWGFWKRKK